MYLPIKKKKVDEEMNILSPQVMHCPFSLYLF